jgi:predicted regulator of Ras-like GTPase activity (Roadblock/LC7/MglB family)
MKAVLQQVLDRLPGALGAAVVGLDGIPVEKAAVGSQVNIDLWSAEGAGVVKRAAGALRDRASDALEEVTIRCQSTCVILRALGSDYYLCLVVGPDCIPGQARYEAWRAGLQLREAIA